MRRAFLRLVKKRFDEQGIEIPFPQTTVHFGPDASPELPAPGAGTATRSVSEHHREPCFVQDVPGVAPPKKTWVMRLWV